MRARFALAALILTGMPGAAQAMQDQYHDNVYPAEEAAARALTGAGRFVIACADDVVTYRYGAIFARGEAFGPCGAETPQPRLVRVRAFPDGSRLFLVESNGAGAVNSGTILFHDGRPASRLRLIDIDNLWYFAQVRTVDRVVMHDGNVTQSNGRCGMTSWTRELVLDWARERIRQRRLIRRDRC